ncbi:hypothetical protein Lal_00029176 [Lupinus albus]|nr:hypothetical protein Lal_00029176 [Lupinus albus]
MDNINNRFHGILESPSTPPPSPPLFSFIAAFSIAILTFTYIYVFSTIVSFAIILAFFIITVFLCMFIKDRPETVIIDMRERNIFYGQTPQNNQREKGGGNGRRQGSVKKVIGSVVCYGSQAITINICSGTNSNKKEKTKVKIVSLFCAIQLEQIPQLGNLSQNLESYTPKSRSNNPTW